MNVFNRHIVAGAFGTLLTGAAALTAHAATQGAATEPSVMVMNQTLQDGQLNVDYAYLPKKGYAVVYAGKDGKAIGEPLGHVALDAGSHVKFKIKLDKAPAPGTALWVALYEDKDGKDGFDRQADASLWGDKLPYENRVIVQ